MDTRAAASDSRWCLGLPFVDSVPFTVAEAAAVKRRSRECLLGMAAAGLVVAAVLLLLRRPELRNPHGLGETLLTALAVFLVLFAVPAALLWFVSLALRYGRLRRDARAGHVSVFRGEVHPRSPNRVRDRFERAALVRLPRDGMLELRALPHSRRWLRPLAAEGFEFLPVRIQRAAPPPEYAWRVPVHHDLPVIPAPGVVLEQRQLTALERVELECYERDLRQPGVRMLLGLASCTLLMGLGAWRGPSGADGLFVVAGVVLLAVHSRTWFQRWSLAARMKTDLDGGRVLSASTEQNRETSPGGAPTSEFLPMSRMLWIDRGRPAAWREAGNRLRSAA